MFAVQINFLLPFADHFKSAASIDALVCFFSADIYALETLHKLGA